MVKESKNVNRFRVVFYDEDGAQLAKNLSNSVISIHDLPTALGAGLIDENDDWLMYELHLGEVAPWMIRLLVEDDIENKTARDMYELMDNIGMTMSIQILNGNGDAIETFTLTVVDAVEVEMKDLDITTSDKQGRLITFTYENVVNSLKKL